MAVPALVFVAFNLGREGAAGWGIPTATDIAFAVGVVSLLGSRVPSPLKLFLLTLAIVDDLLAILIIAVFYTNDLSFVWLGAAAGLLVVVALCRQAKVWYVPVYILLGTFVWFATFKSGVHATIAGVALGFLTPAKPLREAREGESLSEFVDDAGRCSRS
jgi:NhaA family Na+:H+ antiporter